MNHPPQDTSERLATRINTTDGVRRHGPAFSAFADAVGHVQVVRDPELFSRTLVGVWPSMDGFVHDFVTQSGLREHVERLPEPLRPYMGIDPERVATHLRAELLVLEVEERVWVFDVPKRPEDR